MARWNHDAALVPPLELPGGDTGQIEDIARAEAVFQHSLADSASKHFVPKCLTPFLLEWRCLSIPIVERNREWQLTLRIHLAAG